MAKAAATVVLPTPPLPVMTCSAASGPEDATVAAYDDAILPLTGAMAATLPAHE